jgi:non-ribosomal peptide synthase protein (TIGR01720 family)
MEQAPAAEVLFNYLGTLHELSGQSSRFRLNGYMQGARGLKGPRPYLIEINACVIHDQLEVLWTFSTDRHRHETIQDISGKFLQSLRMLINHCLKPSGDEPSVSDFPLANLNAEKLAKLSKLLDKSDHAEE